MTVDPAGHPLFFGILCPVDYHMQVYTVPKNHVRKTGYPAVNTPRGHVRRTRPMAWCMTPRIVVDSKMCILQHVCSYICNRISAGSLLRNNEDD